MLNGSCKCEDRMYEKRAVGAHGNLEIASSSDRQAIDEFNARRNVLLGQNDRA
jgi:hypothetical protein